MAPTVLSALVFRCGGPAASLLPADLSLAGLNVLASVPSCDKLVQAVQAHAPDLLLCALLLASPEFLEAIAALSQTAPLPVALWVQQADADTQVLLVAAGVHACVVDVPGVGANSAGALRAVADGAMARFAHDQALRLALRAATDKLEDRKVVDRAKLILMRARSLSDDDAFRVLRTASMHSNLRLSEVSRHIIDSAHLAEAVNRAGQLRMLSQRLVKLYLLQLAQAGGPDSAALLAESVQRIDGNLAQLGKTLSRYSFGEQLDTAAALWVQLKRALTAAPQVQALAPFDALAEQLLAAAEHLTSSLEGAGAAPLRVLNLAGRQRMLTQRFAKYALLRGLGAGAAGAPLGAAMSDTRAAFEAAQHALNNLPLSTPEIRRALDATKDSWQQLLTGAASARTANGRTQLASASEELLLVLEALSSTYETSMQMLMG